MSYIGTHRAKPAAHRRRLPLAAAAYRLLAIALLAGAFVPVALATPAHAQSAESNTSAVAARVVYPRWGEGVIAMTTRTCGTSAPWRSVAAVNRIYGPAFVIYYGRAYTVSCTRPASSTASRSTAPTTASRTYVRPVAGQGTSSCYGWRAWSNSFHQGIDLPRPYRMPIRSIAAGTVVSAGWNGGYGREVVVSHGHGLWSQYAHASAFAVGSGRRVAAGTVIAYVGSTGNSTGNHLHFEIRTGTRQHRINPAPWLRSHGIGMGC